MNYPINVGDITIDNPTALIAWIVAIDERYKQLDIKYNSQAIELAKHELRLSKVESIIADNQLLLAKLMTEKADKTELVVVEDVLTGNDASVANIKSLRDELQKIIAKKMLAGDTNPTMDITSCMLKPTPIKVLSFTLDKGVYAFDGVIHHEGNEDARGELYFQVGATEIEKSIITFQGDGNAPITTLIEITADNKEVKLMAKRVSGSKLDIMSNQRVKSYCRWIRIS